MCILARPSGGQLACRGSIVNVPSNFPVVVQKIPRCLQQKELIGIQFMRRLADFHPHFTRFVRVQVVKSAAAKLVKSQLYQDFNVSLDEEWNDQRLSCDHKFLTDPPEPSQSTKDDHDCFGSFDTLTNDFVDVETPQLFYRVAPGENQKPLSIFTDDFAEKASFPSVFGGKSRPRERFVDVTYGTIAKAESRSKFTRFQKPSVLFFKYNKLKISQVYSKISIALRQKKDKAPTITAFDIKYNDAITQRAKADNCFALLKNQRFSPQWYAALRKVLLAEVRQKGKATWFFTLSSAESHWADLLKILYSLQYPRNAILSADQLFGLPFSEKRQLIRNFPTAVARHFHHRLQ